MKSILSIAAFSLLLLSLAPHAGSEDLAPRLGEEPVLVSPLPAVTINGFYTKQRVVKCPPPTPGGFGCEINGWLAARCNSGDVATGGGAYLKQIGSSTISGTNFNTVPQGVGEAPSALLARVGTITEGWQLHIRAVCADL